MSSRATRASVALASVLAVAVPVMAHHGAASFDTARELTLKGTVTEWTWSNPHCFLRFDVTNDRGGVDSWVVETQNPVGISAQGFRRTSFKAGDIVTVTLNPVKGDEPVGRLRSVVLPNGTRLPMPGAPPPAPAN